VPAFFRGFYTGLMGNAPSALDIVCLLAAIPYSAEQYEYSGQQETTSDRIATPHLNQPAVRPISLALKRYPGFAAMAGKKAGPSNVSDARVVATLFSILAAALSGLSAGFCAAVPSGQALDMVGDTFTMLSLVARGCFYVAELIDKNDPWVIAGAGGLVSTVALFVGIAYLRDKGWVKDKVGKGKAAFKENISYLLMIAASIEIIYADAEFINESWDEAVSGIFSLLSYLLGFFIREKRPFSPVQAILLGLAQGGMQGGCTAMYALRPIKGT
jgi:hypothetical protein